MRKRLEMVCNRTPLRTIRGSGTISPYRSFGTLRCEPRRSRQHSGERRRRRWCALAGQLHGEAHSLTIADAHHVTAVSSRNLPGDEEAQAHVRMLDARGCAVRLEKRLEEHLDLFRRDLVRKRTVKSS